jgi:DNA-binding MurR/RpiR family transcriptional regulator
LGRIADRQLSDDGQPDLRRRLTASLDEATRTEKTIASYLLGNFKSLPFETAATLAQKIGVSEASIGRYCRKVGFLHLKDLKATLQVDLGDRAWLIGDRLRDFAQRSRNDKAEMARGLEREIAAIVSNYELAGTPEFSRLVERLAQAGSVFIAGFQTERGHAAFLAHGLQYLRPGVRLADMEGGHFAEIMMANPSDSALVLVDGRRYSRLTHTLARRASENGIPVTLITDPYCDWGRDCVSEMFAIQTDLNQFWDATSPISSFMCLVINGVFKELGPEVEDRMARVSSLYNDFIGHAGDPRGPQK